METHLCGSSSFTMVAVIAGLVFLGSILLELCITSTTPLPCDHLLRTWLTPPWKGAYSMQVASCMLLQAPITFAVSGGFSCHYCFHLFVHLSCQSPVVSVALVYVCVHSKNCIKHWDWWRLVETACIDHWKPHRPKPLRPQRPLETGKKTGYHPSMVSGSLHCKNKTLLKFLNEFTYRTLSTIWTFIAEVASLCF